MIQDRLLGRTIRQRLVEYPTLLQQVAIGLGAECPHPHLNRWHKQRHWGLCLCAWPCHQGMSRFSGDPKYEEFAKTWAEELVKADPALRKEFVERVFRQGDRQFWPVLLERIRHSYDKAADAIPE